MTPSEAIKAGVCPGCLGSGRVERCVPYDDVFPCSTCGGSGIWPARIVLAHPPHNEEDAYAAGEHDFPDGMDAERWYVPTERGLEAKIGERLDSLRDRDAVARTEDKDRS